MNALRIPVRVTRTLIAPTVTVLTAARVKKVSLEMVHLVKVCNTILLAATAPRALSSLYLALLVCAELVSMPI